MRLQVVPAATGLLWVRLGIRTFWAQPLAMSGLFFLFTAAVSLLGLLPYIGGALSLLLVPAATVGLMVAAREASDGRFPMPATLITAFRGTPEQTRAMLQLGLLYAGAILLILALTTLADGGAFARMHLLGGTMDVATVQQSGFLLATLMTLALYLPVSMMFWHAPALVYWHQVPVAKALFFSLVACARNFGAMTVYSLAWGAVFISVMILLTIVGALLGSAEFVAAMVFPVGLLLIAMFFTSIYFTFRDSFYNNPPEQP